MKNKQFSIVERALLQDAPVAKEEVLKEPSSIEMRFTSKPYLKRTQSSENQNQWFRLHPASWTLNFSLALLPLVLPTGRISIQRFTHHYNIQTSRLAHFLHVLKQKHPLNATPKRAKWSWTACSPNCDYNSRISASPSYFLLSCENLLCIHQVNLRAVVTTNVL